MSLKLDIRLTDTDTGHFYYVTDVELMRDDSTEEWSVIQAEILEQLGQSLTQARIKTIASNLTKAVIRLYAELKKIRGR